jgi:hypothetical protein
LQILIDRANNDENSAVRWGAVRAVAEFWTENPIVLPMLLKWACLDRGSDVRSEAISNIATHFPLAPQVFETLSWVVENDPFQRDIGLDEEIRSIYTANPRQRSLEALLKCYKDNLRTLALLHDRALNDPDDQLRTWAQTQLKLLEANP